MISDRDNTFISQQLNNEIEKLKEQDYTSYQKFYSQTAQYLYGVIWETVQDQETANILVGELYNEIYASIGTELSDNSRFYEWAENKARNLSTTYVTAHVTGGVEPSDKDLAKMTVVAATSDFGTGQAAISENVAGTAIGNVGMSSTSGGAGNVGMSSSNGGTVNAGVSSADGGNALVRGKISKSSRKALGHLVGNKAGKAGLSLGAKIAIAATSAALVIGGGVGVFKILKSKDKTPEVTTEFVSSTEFSVTLPGEENDETAARYKAYYDVIREMDAKIYYQWITCADGLVFAQLVDFNGDGNEQLVIATCDLPDDVCSSIILYVSFDVQVYDYVNGSAVLADEIKFEDELCTQIFLGIQRSNTDGNYLWVGRMYKDVDVYSTEKYTYYGFDGDKLVEQHSYKIDYEPLEASYINTYEYIDDEKVEPDVYVAARDAAIQGIDYYYLFNECTVDHSNPDNHVGYCPVNKMIIKTLLIKHRTIQKLAEASGDENMLNAQATPGFDIDSQNNSMNYIIYSAENKYHECYIINDYYDLSTTIGDDNISSDGYSLHLIRDYALEEDNVLLGESDIDAEVYFTYVDDVLLPVGERYSAVNGESNIGPYCSWMTVEDYIVTNPSQSIVQEHTISQEEFDAMGNELMTK